MLLLLLLVDVLLPGLSAPAAAQVTESFSFGPFTTADGNISIRGDAQISRAALQITPDSRNKDLLTNRSGRTIFQRPFRLWENSPLPPPSNINTTGINNSTTTNTTTRVVASFNTSFRVNVFRDTNTTPGEGIAFAIFPRIEDPPPGSFGEYLGLTNAGTDGNATNRIVAIELDTVRQLPYDNSSNHMGLDINGVRSVVAQDLDPFNITISPENATIYMVWVEYSGPRRLITVYMDLDGQRKPARPVINASIDLSKYLAQRSYFGFSASTGATYQLNCILGWNLTVDFIPEQAENHNNSGNNAGSWVLKVGLPIFLVVAIVGAVGAVYWHKGKVRNDRRLELTLGSLPGMPKEFRYSEIKKATNNFDEKRRLGQGGFGIVYKGILREEETEVAVKMFSRENMQGDFLAELTIINRLRHRHLVRLLGWCYKKGKLLLVYEYMPNGSLDAHLFDVPPERILPWYRRYKVITGVASALHYLHNEFEQKVVHRDLKASNIMLDADFNARLGDFGLARAIDNERTSYAEVELDGVPGTMGYVAPECFHTGKATRETDVYGFGAVVLEVVCGRRPRLLDNDGGGELANFRFLVDWVWKQHREGNILDAVDARLRGEYDAEDAERLLLLGLACSHPNSGDRPKMETVLQIISRAIPPPRVPPFRPAFMWPAPNDDGDCTTTTLGSSSSSSRANSSVYGYANTRGGWTSSQFTSTDSI